MKVENVVISTQHTKDVTHAAIRDFLIEHVVRKVIPAHMLDQNTKYLINPTGRFVVGGPEGDSGLTGRKIIVDTYGGWGRHGGGAFSGKDPSKVDRSAAYMCRWVAKNIVASGLAEICELQVAYAIGYPEPVSVWVDSMGTGKVPTTHRESRRAGLQLQARRHRQTARSAPPDLPADDQLRALRQARPPVGADRPDCGTAGRRAINRRDRLLRGGQAVRSPVGLLPREAGLAEMPIVGRLPVNRTKQIELFDDVGGLEAENLRHGARR